MPSKYPLQTIINIAEICAKHHIENSVLSPGSRCAPLLIAFSSHPNIQCYSVSDERSAAYIALGMAQATKKPVVLVCTSGTAAANYLPAITEAHYQQVPLLVLTADRPPEWIDQQDGQTIRQQGIFGSYVKKGFQFPVNFAHEDAIWHSERIVNEAVLLSQEGQKGPVHINIPIREPFYPEKNAKIEFGKPKIIQESTRGFQLPKNEIEILKQGITQFNKILIVKGQSEHDAELGALLKMLNVPVVVDVISNEHLLSNGIKHQDAFLGRDFKGKADLQPDLLITFGKSVISKQLKLFLRKDKRLVHWHIQPYGEVADTFQSLQQVIRISPLDFFKVLSSVLKKKGTAYLQKWQRVDSTTKSYINKFFETQAFNEFSVIKTFLQKIPGNSVLHLANSMAVRYANFIGLDKDVKVFSNRGTSGIDGCLSTAVGHAASNEKTHYVITGDLAFFYDANSLWNTLPKNNLRILLINNFGGAIFGMIPGPANTDAYQDYFVTEQSKTAEQIAEMHQLAYHPVNNKERLAEIIPQFTSTKQDSAQIVEVMSSEKEAIETVQQFRAGLQAHLDKSL